MTPWGPQPSLEVERGPLLHPRGGQCSGRLVSAPRVSEFCFSFLGSSLHLSLLPTPRVSLPAAASPLLSSVFSL